MIRSTKGIKLSGLSLGEQIELAKTILRPFLPPEDPEFYDPHPLHSPSPGLRPPSPFPPPFVLHDGRCMCPEMAKRRAGHFLISVQVWFVGAMRPPAERAPITAVPGSQRGRQLECMVW